ncbi:extracellular catalytic domain type 1 short-chain-length polyhydroxyalkanoate depolymerase [Actinoplanes aureus]|uniref:Polyhydroxybutyrate depolymerase n=1 Tax=Actinoplanes aureus TaxID=2792083 RepID=A0A931C7Q8_9ACTN|nr:polyhydroxybutyrate depolymerase [Actinoplanes aureus]MBG0563734.1 polyhydroxybutyrate depolymerase [Actinoplanes aureus]
MRWPLTFAIAALVSLTAPASADAAARCTSALKPGDHTLPVTFQGRQYPVNVYVPAGARGAAVINLHGTQSTGAGQLEYSDMRSTADAGRFLVLAPSGAIPAAGGFAWNVPGVGTPPAGARDDVAFLDQVITTATTSLCVDRTRVYGTGYSGGGRMMSAFACHRPHRIAAIAPVAGLRAGRPDPVDTSKLDPLSCTPGRAVPVITFHGLQDATNPFPGGGSPYWGYSVPAAQQRWAQINKCSDRPRTTTVSTNVSKVSYQRCRGGAEVVLYTIANGGHTWPGTSVDNGNGTVTHEINANRLMWQFFERH